MLDAHESEKLLVDAFNSLDFENLDKIRLSIEKEIRNFIIFLQENNAKEIKIFENPESRIKSVKSFNEKILRKNYVEDWPVTEDLEENKATILKELPDLIGFRINCFFMPDENAIYEYLKSYYNARRFSSDMVINFEEKTKQKNGHEIFKVSGRYNNQCGFEIQIKSLMHNVWGEVEHRTIYKGRQYEADIEPKKIITEEIFNILRASDSELRCVFKKRNNEKELLQALFFEQTSEEIESEMHTDILGNHYNNFFVILSDHSISRLIKHYVANTLLGTAFSKKHPNLLSKTENIDSLKNIIQEKFIQFDLKCIYCITAILIEFKDFDEFLRFMADCLLKRFELTEDEELEDDAFGDENNENQAEQINEAILTYLGEYLRKKDDK